MWDTGYQTVKFSSPWETGNNKSYECFILTSGVSSLQCREWGSRQSLVYSLSWEHGSGSGKIRRVSIYRKKILERIYLHRKRIPNSSGWLFSGISLNTDVCMHVSKLPASGIRGLEVTVLIVKQGGTNVCPHQSCRKPQDS